MSPMEAIFQFFLSIRTSNLSPFLANDISSNCLSMVWIRFKTMKPTIESDFLHRKMTYIFHITKKLSYMNRFTNVEFIKHTCDE